MKPSENKPIRIALAGFGTVGTGIARLLIERGEALRARTGLLFEIAHVLVRDPHRPRDVSLPRAAFVTSPEELLADGSVDILVEVMGGTTVARDLVLSALAARLPVVTANKALLALHGREVFAAARRHGSCIAFEAACAGGVPVIAAIQRGLIANRIDALYGIVNGTCNYILTEMLDRSRSYQDALHDAQRLGYAEADPTLDVNGTDSAHKLAILASLAFGADVAFERIDVEGIGGLEPLDLRIAQRLGYACKLLAIGRRNETGLSLRVHPSLVPLAHPLAQVPGPRAGVWFAGDAMDSLFLSGSGAGSLPTASAVVSDLVEAACGNTQRSFDQLRLFNDQNAPPSYVAAENMAYRHYLRCPAAPDASNDAIERVLAEHSIRVDARRTAAAHARDADPAGAGVVVTAPGREADFTAALRKLKELAGAAPVFVRIVEPS